MRYYRENGQEFLENGKSLLRVRTVGIFPDPGTPLRGMRAMQVEQAVRQSMTNLIPAGAIINMSFPREIIQSVESYHWMKGERMQVLPPRPDDGLDLSMQ